MKGQKKKMQSMKLKVDEGHNCIVPQTKQRAKLNNSAGITLVALVVSIVVMLILAGVSINAVVGDNGIITQAQSATYATSRAVLEEWINQLYVENYDDFSEKDTMIDGFLSSTTYSAYFYNPSTDDNIGNLSYVVDSDGYAHYLIKKSALPDEIRNQISGGDAGDGTYTDYATLNDVYGVTNDLKVYYCSNGINTILGVTTEELSEDDPERLVTISTELANLLGIDANTTARQLRRYKTLTIDSTVSSLSDLYNFSNLQILYLTNASLSSLSGIENCPYLYEIYNTSSTIGDYTAVGELGSRLTHLYFYNITDIELETACSKTVGIGGYDLPNLEYFAVVGNTKSICDTSVTTISSQSEKSSSIYSVSYLDTLTSTTKQAVRYLSLQNNYLTSLEGIGGFTGVTVLRCEYNSIANLDEISTLTNLKYLICYDNEGLVVNSKLTCKNLYLIDIAYCTAVTSLYFLEDCSSITYIYADYCAIGYGEGTTKNEDTDSLAVLSGKSSLTYLSLTYNTNLAWIDYISNCSSLKYLYLEGCTGLNSTSIYEIKTLIASLGENCIYPAGYAIALLDDSTTYLDLTDETLEQDDFETIGKYTKITHLSLKNVVVKDSDGNEITNDTNTKLDTLYTTVLSNLSAMKYLQLYGVSNLTTIDFVENMEGLLELDIRDTSITDLSLLETMTEENEQGTSSFSLATLAVNVAGTDLSTIPNTISNMYDCTDSYWTKVDNSVNGGIQTDNITVLQTLAGSNITALRCCHTLLWLIPDTYSLDLSGCKSLKKYYCELYNSQVSLPSSVISVFQWAGKGAIFATGTKLEYYGCNSLSSTTGSGILQNLLSCSSVLEINLNSITVSSFADITNLEQVLVEKLTLSCVSSGADFSELKIPSTLTYLRMNYGYHESGSLIYSNTDVSILSPNGTSLQTLWINGTNIESATLLNGLTKLTYVDLSYNCILSLENLETELSNLTALSLANNNLIGVQGVQYLVGVYSLNLSNNSLGNTDTYNGATYNNLQLLIDLFESNSSFRTLNISSNSGINKQTTQWTTLANLAWTKLTT